MKKVTFKEFVLTLTAGVWQAVKWILGLFGYHDSSRYGIFVRRVFAGCVTIFMVLMVMAALNGVYDHISSRLNFDEDSCISYVRYVSRHVSYDEQKKEIINNQTDEKIRDVDWIAKSVDGDTLVCYSSKGKRGYFNLNTAKVEISPRYDKAWIFSEGIACVCNNDSLYFIDHKGNKVFENVFQYSQNSDGYVFHNGYCIIATDDYKYGVIDRFGDWELKPKYIDLHQGENHLWVIKEDNARYGLYNDSLKQVVLPCEYRSLWVNPDGITALYQDYQMKSLNFDLSIRDSHVVSDVETLRYDQGIIDDDGNEVTYPASCLSYKVESAYSNDMDERYGLMSSDGSPLTTARFSSITAINDNLYKCEYGKGYVLVDGEGKEVK